MKKRALAFLLLISMVLQPMTSVLATETETPTVSSEEKETEETLERPLDTMTQELLESEPTSEETPTETTDSIDEPEAPIDIEPPAPTPETLSAPRAVTTVPWGQTICTIEGKFDLGYTITVRAGSGTVAGTRDQAPWTSSYRIFVKKIIFDGSDGKIQLVGNQTNLFSYCGILESIDLSGVDTSQVTDMSWMFASCYDLSSLDVSGFDTSHVTDMSNMFNECNQLSSLDVSGFDTSHVTDMSNMFKSCESLSSLDVRGFDTSHVTDMSSMFNECYQLSNLDVSGFDTSHVTDMSSMFSGCYRLSNLDVRGFDTSNVTDMSSMFNECYQLSNLDVSGFDTSHVTNMSYMFHLCTKLSSLDVSGFDTSQVIYMDQMFVWCSNLLNLDVSGFDTSQVMYMNYMFYRCSNLLNLDLSSFDTSAVIDMSWMFADCNKLECIKLGSQTKLSIDCSLSDVAVNEFYTGKWITVGNGTLEKPNGDWSGTVAELCARSQTGVADTYVWEPKTYTITFDVNGGSNPPAQITEVYKGEMVDLSTVTSPTPPTSAYEFAGWTTVIDDFTTKVETLTMPANDVTLYAHWKVLMEINSIPDEFIFKHNVMRNEYTPQFVTLNSQAYTSKVAFKTNWQSTLDWKLTVTMAEWCNPDDATDTLTGVQMYMNNQLTHQDGSSAPSTIHSNQQVVLNAGETQTLVTTTAGNSADGTGNWQSTIDFDSVKLKIPRYGGREGSYYTSQLTWSLDDTI
ncbi:BspA family leucine-rich repeat surface protein [Vagococcus lutrae]|uniref:BspA family leucine-rich repeat surface protein n=1 Tax=Vagococcus lutrae TaxID=81947 RepID=UPI000F892801|nr:BspA family leucine-rich repeat surface protein [Vagococcus lutrae]RST92357.1 hypothetical protein CBF33_05220 [Vagococcus lutrae]